MDYAISEKVKLVDTDEHVSKKRSLLWSGTSYLVGYNATICRSANRIWLNVRCLVSSCWRITDELCHPPMWRPGTQEGQGDWPYAEADGRVPCSPGRDSKRTPVRNNL